MTLQRITPELFLIPEEILERLAAGLPRLTVVQGKIGSRVNWSTVTFGSKDYSWVEGFVLKLFNDKLTVIRRENWQWANPLSVRGQYFREMGLYLYTIQVCYPE